MTPTPTPEVVVPLSAVWRLILAADSYGVQHLGSDDMDQTATELQDATEAMKDLIAAQPVVAPSDLSGERGLSKTIPDMDKAVIASLVEALEPFAAAASLYSKDIRPDLPLSAPVLGIRTALTVADLQSASAAVVGATEASATMNVALRDVAAERQRQVTVESWSQAHDDEHCDGSLARAAASYAFIGSFEVRGEPHATKPVYWPWDKAWWKPKDRRSDLIRAGALIIAEIERLDRAGASA